MIGYGLNFAVQAELVGGQNLSRILSDLTQICQPRFTSEPIVSPDCTGELSVMPGSEDFMKRLMCLVFVIGMLWVGIVHASDVVVVLAHEFMPFNGLVTAKDGSKQAAGMTFDILEESVKYGAPQFVHKYGLPWKRAQFMLYQAGDSPTATVPFTRTPKRETSYTWIAELFPYDFRLATYKRRTTLTIEEAKSLEIGIVRGSANIPFLRQLGVANIQEVTSPLQNAQKLAVGRIDAIATGQYIDTYYWRKIGMEVKDLQFTPLEKRHIYIAGNLKFPSDIARRIHNAVRLMRENGTLQDILARWEN